ncbi:hypothetical protein ENSA5_24260 [Enhygromyxa salina]|uniref:PEGA domain-containing protein n=1 Tax=Enhygromyxa salina TaxID=215803 RepID=A0A2S9YB50_9BACT|nr:hypothetical protein [Enhygromyxa salina]PRQ02335.1 hypothetical protein ENSA5_24260 [Enhygromyxa salina]
MLFEFVMLAALAGSPAPTPTIGEDCGEQVCLYASDRSYKRVIGDGVGSWKAETRLNRNKRKKEAKKNRKRKDVALNVVVEGRRGSVFVDGRYLAATGEHAQRVLKPGKHEVEVRDGEEVITFGVLSVPRKVSAIALVVHADR